MSKCYNAVVFCTGMSDSKRNWPKVPRCYGADEIFGWYNMNPYKNYFEQDLSKSKRLVIIGNGNVALDMVRIFAKRPSSLASAGVSEHILRTLENSSINEILILGRRELNNVQQNI